MKKTQAVTLLETILVLSMMVGLLSLVTMVFIRGQRITVLNESYASVQQEAMTCLRRLSQEFQKGSYLHMVIGGGQDEVAFLSYGRTETDSPTAPDIEFDPNTGRIVWKKWIFLYRDGDGRLNRGQIPLTTPISDLVTVPDPIADLPVFRTMTTSQPIGNSVEQFQIAQTGVGVHVQLSVARKVPLPLLTEEQKKVMVSVKMDLPMVN